jgi:hypothetical protein
VSARRALALAVVALLAAAPTARADGDPASDVLLQADVFFPYAPATSPALAKALEGLLQRTRQGGYPMKVALIASAGDLGAYPQMFNAPQEYASLLASELPNNPHGKKSSRAELRPHLLVVMPGGFGGDNLGDAVDAALAPVTIESAAQADGLAKAALAAVARIATANGHETPVPPEASTKLAETTKSTDRGSGTPVWIFIAPVLLVVAGAVVAGRIATRRSQEAADAKK